MQDWKLYKKVGGVWTFDTNLPRPQANLSKKVTSNQVKIKLADGDNGFLMPEITFDKGVITLTWIGEDGTIASKIEDYIQNKRDTKIENHLAEEYIGRFIYVDSVWRVGIYPDAYDVVAYLELMEL